MVSDWDQSGAHLFSALAEDVTAFAGVDAPGTEIVFERLAVTEQQIADYQTAGFLHAGSRGENWLRARVRAGLGPS
ncbi:hypothetical protein [Streptomyces sp. NBC_01455]|uniref:hypothetical protein n=1 Tax=Streptomyces sp. NBC_01455 TaxID=2903874 RepID=UPI002E32BC0B|nr:hypothetical protein [Streptomyces sp. NBC_01455]